MIIEKKVYRDFFFNYQSIGLANVTASRISQTPYGSTNDELRKVIFFPDYQYNKHDELTDVSLSINRHYRHPRNYKSEYGERKLDIKKVLQALFDEQRDGRIMLEGGYTYEDIDIYKRRRECS